MMNKAIKLLVLAGALLSVGAMAQATQTWKFGFPTYAYIYTNTTSIYFDFTDDTADGTTATTISTLDEAGLGNLQDCIDGLIGNISSVTADDTAGTDLGTCYFAPSGIDQSGYTVDWSNVDTDGADGSLLVVTNSDTYNITVSVATPPTDVVFWLEPTTSSNITDGTSFNTSFDSSTTSYTDLLDEGNGYSTQYYNTYVIPLSYAVEVSPSVADQTLTDYDMTYTITAP